MGNPFEKISVRISRDRMTAEVKIDPAPPLPSLEQVRTFLLTHKVLFGIEEEAVRQAIAAPETWTVVAHGRPPTKPVHGHVEYHFDTSATPHIKIADDGKADLKEMGMIQNVIKGFVLASLVDPVPGSSGMDVSGNVIATEEPKPATLKPGKFVTVSIDGRRLTADVDGRAILDRDGRVSVENVLTIRGDVGPETGNIDFLGSVEVHGNVCSDYRVKAVGRVEINGHVEAAVVEAGQAITVTGGVFGAGKAILQCPGDITLRHAQEATILSGGAILAVDGLVRVNAVAAKGIHVEKGAIVGGSVTAPEITAKALGSESDARTIVELGIAPRAKLVCGRFETEFRKARTELLKVRERLDPLRSQHDAGKPMSNEENKEMISLEKREEALVKSVLEASAGIVALLGKPDACVESRLEIEGAVHPGVVFSSVHMERAVRQFHKSLIITASGGKMSGGAES